jgi:hypothetical protein
MSKLLIYKIDLTNENVSPIVEFEEFIELYQFTIIPDFENLRYRLRKSQSG